MSAKEEIKIEEAKLVQELLLHFRENLQDVTVAIEKRLEEKLIPKIVEEVYSTHATTVSRLLDHLEDNAKLISQLEEGFVSSFFLRRARKKMNIKFKKE